jgi:hypothetical protein
MPDEAKRLAEYYPFDTDVLETVARVADEQRSTTWGKYRLALPEVQLYTPDDNKPVQIVDIIPEGGYDDVQIHYSPMGCRLDANMLTRIATFAAALPTTRLIASGNASVPGADGGKAKFGDIPAIWSGDLRPTVAPTLAYVARYFDSQQVNAITQVGYSFGADKAATGSQLAADYNLAVRQGIYIDPASVVWRGIPRLAYAFHRAGKSSNRYVAAADSEVLNAAKAEADRQGYWLAGYVAGLLRPTNFAIAHALSRDGFEGRVRKAFESQPEGIDIDIVWGSRSELATHGLILAVTKRLAADYGQDRVRATAIEDQTHAMANDIFLHAAILLQSRKSHQQQAASD